MKLLTTVILLMLTNAFVNLPIASGDVQIDNTITFGVTPWEKEETLIAYYKPLMEYFEKQLHLKTKFVVTQDYDGLKKSVLEKDIDFAFCSPKIYVKMKNEISDLKYLLTIINQDEAGRETDYYKGVILTLKNSSIQKISNLKNKKFGFINKDSSSGFLFPNQLLVAKKINYENYFSQTYWLENHARAVGALVNKSVDAIATWDGGLLNGKKEHGDIFRILAETEPIPSDAVVGGPHIKKEMAKAIETSLLLLKKESSTIQAMNQQGFKIVGFKKRSDRFYDVIRKALNKK